MTRYSETRISTSRFQSSIRMVRRRPRRSNCRPARRRERRGRAIMNDLQKNTAKAIVNVFETGKVRGRYNAIAVLKGDSGHLSYGRSQAALGSGSLYLLLKSYCEAAGAKFADRFVPLLPRFRDKDVSLDFDQNVRSLLEQAGDDPVMQQAQDDFFDRGYWQPAVKNAAACGLTKPLSVAVIYDSH